MICVFEIGIYVVYVLFIFIDEVEEFLVFLLFGDKKVILFVWFSLFEGVKMGFKIMRFELSNCFLKLVISRKDKKLIVF